MHKDDPASAVFEFEHQAVEVTPLSKSWRVSVGEQTVERRRLDEALGEFFGRSRAVLRLQVEILDWAHANRGA